MGKASLNSMTNSTKNSSTLKIHSRNSREYISFFYKKNGIILNINLSRNNENYESPNWIPEYPEKENS